MLGGEMENVWLHLILHQTVASHLVSLLYQTLESIEILGLKYWLTIYNTARLM